MKLVVELLPPAAGDDACDGCVPTGTLLAGTLPPVAVGLPALPDAPDRDESPLLIGAAAVAVLDDVAPVSLAGVAVATTAKEPATTVMTATAKTPRRAKNRRR
jgi:hypothetical protein